MTATKSPVRIFLNTIFHSVDRDIHEIVHFSSPISRTSIYLLRNAMPRVATEVGGLLGPDIKIVDRLANGDPIDLQEVGYLVRASDWAPQMAGVERTQEDLERFEVVKADLRDAYDRMNIIKKSMLGRIYEEKLSRKAINKQIYDMDMGAFQKRIVLLSMLAAMFSAISAFGSFIVALLPLLR